MHVKWKICLGNYNTNTLVVLSRYLRYFTQHINIDCIYKYKEGDRQTVRKKNGERNNLRQIASCINDTIWNLSSILRKRAIFTSISFNTYINESAKLRALRGKNVLTCKRALCAYVLTCKHPLRADVLTCQRALGAYVLTCQRVLRARVLT